MPFGLCNAPSTFERLMERVLTGLQWEVLLVYLDDVIVYATNVEDEIRRLGVVFQRFRGANLKLKPKKCSLFQAEVLYLGHVVSEAGVGTDPAKVESIRDWPVPENVRDVRSFLGLAAYYRKFIPNFSMLAGPLFQLTEKSRVFEWGEKQQQAFETIQQKLQASPVLAYPDIETEFLLDTDASNTGIGAVLSQVQDGQERVIAYGSKTLTRAERNYCVTRRELLALVYFLKHFRQYLYGQRITIRTDHASLRWLLNFKNPEGQLARWFEVISEYQFTVIHRPGAKHGNADGLSRRPCKQCGREEVLHRRWKARFDSLD